MHHQIHREMSVPIETLLHALDGLSYVADAEGVLIAVSKRRWDVEAEQSGGPLSAQVIGGSLFDVVRGEDVQRVWREMHERALRGQANVAFEYRCDAPDLRRQMRMSVSRLDVPELGALVLYQSQLLSAVARPWITLFEPERALEVLRSERHLPIVLVCSFCQQVKAEDEWVEPDFYYRRGGDVDVRVSHGVCPSCSHRLAS